MRALRDHVLRVRFGANARKAVLPLTSDAMTARLLALYQGLLQARGA
jgi:hypothetical protein